MTDTIFFFPLLYLRQSRTKGRGRAAHGREENTSYGVLQYAEPPGPVHSVPLTETMPSNLHSATHQMNLEHTSLSSCFKIRNSTAQNQV